MPPIVFFGTEQHSLIALEALYRAQLPVAAVVTKPDAPKGRGKTLTAPAVKHFANTHGIPVWQPSKLSELTDAIAALNSPIGVLVSYGKIIPQSIIDLFTPGIINLHPSLLPRYRGPSPIEAAMTNLDDETGISIMQLDAQMDAGPLYYQERIALTGRETRAELYDRLFTLGSARLVELLPRIANGDLLPTPQQHTDVTYCALLSKQNAPLDPTTLNAAQAEARVRAYLGFPRTTLYYENDRLIITAAHVADSPSTELDQRCSDGRYLVVDELIAPSGKHMNAAAFLRGRRP